MTSAYRLRPGPRTDWFRVLADLERQGADGRAGIGNRGVARRIDVRKSTVIGWKQGAEPRHSDGELLLAIWCEHTGKEREDAPTRDPFAYG